MPTAHSVNARTLAEFSLESGDLADDFRAVERMREGLAGHLAVQGQLGQDWIREESLSLRLDVEGMRLTVQGRADATRRLPGLVEVEEIKTTRQPVQLIGENDYPVHWGQAQVYAYILLKKEQAERVNVYLRYYNMDGTWARFTRTYDQDQIQEIFLNLVHPYARWLKALDERQEISRETMRSMQFPYDGYRAGQRELAGNVYMAMKKGRRLLAEAPTGIGKTAATLFGAVKALGEGHIQHIFYLTARTTGRAAAEDALLRMRRMGLVIYSVTISAKEKVCLNPMGVHCLDCPFAEGYFDRRREALQEALDLERLDMEAIVRFAEAHRLCPFELSLDLSEQADVIICDYNYAFDPRVRLRRYFDGKTRSGLLIDEAHNLPERVRDMLSAELSGKAVQRLLREEKKLSGTKTPLYNALKELLQALPQKLEEPDALREIPVNLPECADLAADAIGAVLSGFHPEAEALRDLMFRCLWLSRVSRMFDDKKYMALVEPEGRTSRVKLWCFDPAPHIESTYKRVSGAALFSATLTPLTFYARDMAVKEEDGDALLSLASPFPRRNLLVLRLPIDTRYSAREETTPQVAEALYAMCAGRSGNYLACFPSHAYLQKVFSCFQAMHPEIRCLRQDTRMNEQQRKDFLNALEAGGRETTLAFIAMGGVFSEGVDLPGERLIGAAIVGVGLPQISFERQQMVEINNDDLEEGGYEYAYVYPGMRKVAQAGGRVIRTERDLGVVLLIDNRFYDPAYRQLLPRHWRVLNAKSTETVRAACKRFWEKYGGRG